MISRCSDHRPLARVGLATRLDMQSLEPRLALSVAPAVVDDEFQPVAAVQPTSLSGPAIASINAPAAKTYGAGAALSFTVTFRSKVVVSGTPTLPVTIGDTIRDVPYARIRGGRNLVFTTIVTAGDVDTDGIQLAGPIGLPEGAAIRTAAGADAATALPARLPNLRRVLVDAVGPGLVAIGPPTVAKKAVTVQARFNESITVRGKPLITVVVGGQERRLAFQKASGNTATFSYKLKNGESAAEVVTDSRITLPTGASIRDKAGNVAVSLGGPTDVSLTGTDIVENSPAGSVVGTLSTTDTDPGDHFEYALVDGDGSTDNASFNILGSQLRATASFDFETKNTYSVRIRSTDQGGLFTEKQFMITVTDLVEMVFVTVGDVGNQADNTGYGAVDYQYLIGSYEVTIGQYTAFLNAVAADDPYGLFFGGLGPGLEVDRAIRGISRSGSPGSYTYSVIAPAGETPLGADSPANRPITYVSWFNAARFANWMHNGQPRGAQGLSTTERGAYTLDGQTSGIGPARNSGATFFIPSENEWYKAAYYSPVKGGVGSPGYFRYATQSDTTPGNTIGNGVNQANYYAGDYTVTQSRSFSESQNYLTNVGAFTNSASYYGTFDQSGNVGEWTEAIVSGSSRLVRGGSWDLYGSFLPSTDSFYDRARLTAPPSYMNNHFGFRLARPG